MHSEKIKSEKENTHTHTHTHTHTIIYFFTYCDSKKTHTYHLPLSTSSLHLYHCEPTQFSQNFHLDTSKLNKIHLTQQSFKNHYPQQRHWRFQNKYNGIGKSCTLSHTLKIELTWHYWATAESMKNICPTSH